MYSGRVAFGTKLNAQTSDDNALIGVRLHFIDSTRSPTHYWLFALTLLLALVSYRPPGGSSATPLAITVPWVRS